MNKQTQEALKMAIEWLDKEPQSMEDFEAKENAINACKEALEQPAQEPNCYGDGNVYRGLRSEDSKVKTYHVNTRPAPAQEQERGFYGWYDNHDIHTEKQSDESIALYTHHYQWQGLTDNEIAEIIGEPIDVMYSGDYEAYRAIEQALKDKNT